MAHRGRKYPVHFRRDFNQNCDVSIPSPLPETWRIVLHSTGTAFPSLEGAVFICTPDSVVHGTDVSWKSEYKRINGFDWQMVVICFYPLPPDSIRTGIFQLFRRDKDQVCAWLNRAATYADPFAFVSGEAHTTARDPSVFPADPHFYLSTANPVGY